MIFMIMLADNEASATADNRAYLATVLRTSAQIPLRGTSDTLRTFDKLNGAGTPRSRGVTKFRSIYRPPSRIGAPFSLSGRRVSSAAITPPKFAYPVRWSKSKLSLQRTSLTHRAVIRQWMKREIGLCLANLY